jgi:hypothetical protein
MASSIAKGKRGEREWTNYLKLFDPDTVRTWEHAHDVYGGGVWWEVKLEKAGYTKVYNALEEHREHYKETGDGPIPHAAIRQDHKEWVVCFYARDWLRGHANFDNSPSG